MLSELSFSDYFCELIHRMQLCDYVYKALSERSSGSAHPATAHVLRANSAKKWGNILHWWNFSKPFFYFFFFCETARRAWMHIHKQLRMSKTFPIHTHTHTQSVTWSMKACLSSGTAHKVSQAWLGGLRRESSRIREDRVSIKSQKIRYAAPDLKNM